MYHPWSHYSETILAEKEAKHHGGQTPSLFGAHTSIEGRRSSTPFCHHTLHLSEANLTTRSLPDVAVLKR